MSSFPEPPKPKSVVKNAGRRIFSGEISQSDLDLVDQWRAAHGYVLNTFKVLIRRRINKLNVNVEFAQRLKRRKTVIDKLQRSKSDGTPLIGDATSMHDFAGCRLIFDSIDELNEFRKKFHSNRFMRDIDHKLQHENSPEKYNYIDHPKNSGYRGIHDVFLHRPRAHRGKNKSEPWKNLRVEIQYRTKIQHAWATAVEISDLIDSERTKFQNSPDQRGYFFQLVSELLARHHENISNSLLGMSTSDIIDEISDIESKLQILHRLEAIKTFEEYDKIKTHNVLSISRNEKNQSRLDVRTFRSAAKAISYANSQESDPASVNAVYVHADNPAQVRSAYRNYFYDTQDFVSLVRGAL